MHVTGIILAGGKSSRMGTDKGLTLLNGKPMIEHIIQALKPCVDEILIVANNQEYTRYGYPVVEDVIKDCGPMGGIYTGLLTSTTLKNLVVSCDIPFITTEMLTTIITKSGTEEITVPKYHDKIEPLCAIYSKDCAERLLQLLQNKKWKMQDALKNFETNEIQLFDAIGRNFININTPQELNEQSTHA